MNTNTATTTDRNGSYVVGTYSDGRAVHIYGTRNGFVYIAFADDLGWITKVPASWVV